ncbi:MAG: DNA polymerase III subunit gamma/tau [Ruminococcaceae bacterium]|nr:DNA polymerase III subunit gamma/tau [Oscillospiraceae bacterium]
MYQALYRKWRPSTFDEMCGQAHIIDILKRQCKTDKISHAYLFCGTRGTGKTSAAKILAKAANCLSPIDGNPCGECENCKAVSKGNATDILEIDAASNNGVDNIRDLRDEVLYPPAYLKKRVYIIDEVHMLSSGAFNALLKTLEEPPEYVIFILATTELHKIPPTILSRCQRFEFRNISSEEIKNRLLFVAKEENISLSEKAAKLIANLADGAMRDGLSLLESCVSANAGGEITEESVTNLLGITENETGLSLFEAIRENNVARAVEIIDEVNASAVDIVTFLEDLSYLTRDMIVTKLGTSGSLNERFVYSEDGEKRLKALAEGFSDETLFRYAEILDNAQSKISRLAINKRLMAEMAVIKLCTPTTSGNSGSSAMDNSVFERIDRLETKISALEKALASSPAPVRHTTPAPVTPEPAKPIQKKAEGSSGVSGIPYSDLLDFLKD